MFRHPFTLKGADRSWPAGAYRVVTDEELVEEMSFPVYRRTATMIFLPAGARRGGSEEMLTVDPNDLEAALARDASH